VFRDISCDVSADIHLVYTIIAMYLISGRFFLKRKNKIRLYTHTHIYIYMLNIEFPFSQVWTVRRFVYI